MNVNSDLQQRITRYEGPAMSRKFPQFKLYKGDGSYSFAPNGSLFWDGSLKTNFGSQYSLAVVYPKNYPHGEILAFVKELMNISTPHRYRDGYLCLYSNNHGGGGEGYAIETTAVAIVAWAAAWLNAYEVWKRTQEWPGK